MAPGHYFRPALLWGDLLLHHLHHPCFDITNNHLASYLSLLIIFPSTSYPPMASLTRVDKRPFAKMPTHRKCVLLPFPSLIILKIVATISPLQISELW